MTTIHRGRRAVGAAASVLVAALLATPVALADDGGAASATTGTPTVPSASAGPAGAG
ncbi:MAG: hypothetical protein JWP82_2233, partial [Humibacillus sp.]|nr:hypothetical protein [Humibacillus sp.]